MISVLQDEPSSKLASFFQNEVISPHPAVYASFGVRSPSVGRPSYAGDIATTVAAAAAVDVAYGVCSIRPPQPTRDARLFIA